MAQAPLTDLSRANKLIKGPGSPADLQTAKGLLESARANLSATQVSQVDSVIRNVDRMISRRGVSTVEAAGPPLPRIPVAPAKSKAPFVTEAEVPFKKVGGLTTIPTKNPDGSQGRFFRVTDDELAKMQSGEIPNPEALIALRREQTLATERPGFIKTFLGELGAGATQVGKGIVSITAPPPTAGEALERARAVAEAPIGALRMIGALPVATSVKTAELIERQSIAAGLAPGPAKTVADTSGMLAALFMPQKIVIGPYRFVANQIRRGLLAARGGARAVLGPIIRATQRQTGTTSLGAGEDTINAIAAKDTELRTRVGSLIEGGLKQVPTNVTRPLTPLKAAVDDALGPLRQVEGVLPSGVESKIGKLKNFIKGRQRAADVAAKEAGEAKLAEMSADDLLDAIDDIMLEASASGGGPLAGSQRVINGVIGAIRESITEAGAAGITMRETRNLTQRLNTVIQATRGRAQRRDMAKLFKVRDGLEKQLESFALEVVAGGAKFPQAVAMVKEGVRIMRDEVGPIFARGGVIEGVTRNRTGSEIVDRLMKTTPERLTGTTVLRDGKAVKIPGITESLDPATRTRLADGFLSRMLERSEDAQVGGFQIRKFLAQIDEPMQGRLKAVMTREDFSKFMTLRGELQRAQEFLRNIPETAQLLMRNSIAETIRGVGTLDLTRVAGAIGTMVGRETGAKLLSSTIALPLLDKATTDPRLINRVADGLRLFNIATVAAIQSGQVTLPEFQAGEQRRLISELLPMSVERMSQVLEQGAKALEKGARAVRGILPGQSAPTQ